MMTRDKGRKGMWWFLGALAAMQLYFVRELLAAYLLFTFGFAALTLLVAGAYMLQKAWEAGLTQAVRYGAPAWSLARRGWGFAEDMTKRPFRRPGSEPVQ
jgi:hypothetical protein